MEETDPQKPTRKEVEFLLEDSLGKKNECAVVRALAMVADAKHAMEKAGSDKELNDVFKHMRVGLVGSNKDAGQYVYVFERYENYGWKNVSHVSDSIYGKQLIEVYESIKLKTGRTLSDLISDMEKVAKKARGLSIIKYDWVASVKGVDGKEEAVPVKKKAFVATTKKNGKTYVIGSGYN